MKKNSFIYLDRILSYIAKIDSYLTNISKTQFEQNSMMQDAIIKQVENIGEAATKLKQLDPQLYQQLDLKEAASMRHILVHDYDQIDIEIIWQTIKQDIPQLKTKLQKILP